MTPLTARNQEAATQGEFDFIFPEDGKALLRVGEVCRAINQRTQFVYDRIQEGCLEAHRRPGSDVSTLNVTRRSVVAYISQSALYEPRDFADTVLKLARTLAPATRRALAQRLLSA